MIASFSLSQVYAFPIVFDDDYILEKFATGLAYPTTMTFVGEDILVLEKDTGKVILIQDNGVIYSEPALDVPVSSSGEAGLLGIASTFNHVYLYFTESLSGFDGRLFNNPATARNVVYQYDWNGEKLTNPILRKELPVLANFHHGGVITVGLNDEIYFVIGDQDQHTTFQNIPVDTIYETGSIFKIDTESNNSVELFAIGIRNSFGLAIDHVTGNLWATENGDDSFDEVNMIPEKFNSGWKVTMGPADRVDSDLSTLNPKPFENFVYSDPEFSWYKSVGLTAIAFPDKDRSSFSRYSDWVFVGDFHNGKIYKFQLNADRTGFVFSNPDLLDLVLDDNDEIDEILFAKGFSGGVTDIKFHNGVMYVVSIFDGSIYKIYPKEFHKKIEEIKFEMLKLLKTRTSNEYVNLSNSDFIGANFETAKISNVNFTQANLSYTNLSGKDLTGTILREADLSNSILTGVDLSGKDLSGAKLRGVDLSGKDLTGTILRGADLSDTNLTGVDLSGMDLSGARLRGVDLSGKDLTGTILTGADLSNSILTGVDLSGMDLTGMILTGADLSDTNLAGVDLSHKDLTGTILTGADLSNADLSDTHMLYTQLNHTNLVNADLRNSIVVKSFFIDTQMEGSNFVGTNVLGTKFIKSNLQNSDFRNSKISYSTFIDTDLSGTNFMDIYPIETSFENVIITKESKINTCLEHDLISRILNKILREIRSNNFNFLNIFEKSIIQLCYIR